MVVLLDDDSSPARGRLDRLFPGLHTAYNFTSFDDSYLATTKTSLGSMTRLMFPYLPRIQHVRLWSPESTYLVFYMLSKISMVGGETATS